MRNPHRNAEVIKAWADGYVIQYKAVGDGYWVDILSGSPHWDGNGEYRIKPEPKPDVVFYGDIYSNGSRCSFVAEFQEERTSVDNLIVTFDGNTGKLKSAEVIS